jgi:hypothetical protein
VSVVDQRREVTFNKLTLKWGNVIGPRNNPNNKINGLQCAC